MATADFDLYLLAQSWASTFCCAKPERCATLESSWSAKRLILHGLWPAYAAKRVDGSTAPSDCKTMADKFDKSVIPPLALSFAPNYHGGLAKHEYNKHGSCSGLGPELYFKESLRTMLSLPRTDRGTPEIISKNVGGSVRSDDLRKCYDKQVAIKVSPNCVLEEITTCWAKEVKNAGEGMLKVGRQMDCPDYLMKGARNNCDSKRCKGIVHITKLGQCDI
jgi:ribonuclease T2